MIQRAKERRRDIVCIITRMNEHPSFTSAMYKSEFMAVASTEKRKDKK